MSLIALIVIIAVVCALLPMDERFKQLLYVIVVVLVIAFLLQLFGVWPGVERIWVSR